MKYLKTAAGMFAFLLAFVMTGQAEAHVTDLVKDKQAAAASYEDYYTLQQRYEGQSGIMFESYSVKWKTVEQLKALEQELLKNKHGKELDYLGKIVIYPDYPAGKQVLGQYYAQYYPSQFRYSDDTKIELYGGNEFTAPDQLAATLSHEYGHHFTYFYLIEGEKVLPENWLSSQYAQARGLDQYEQAHANAGGEYIWNMAEIMAEDYVQLFGSEEAVRDHLQMNGNLQSPFIDERQMEYWQGILKEDQYKTEEPITLYLTDYLKKPYGQYDLQLYSKALSGAPTYLMAQDSTFKYKPLQLAVWNSKEEQESWFRYDQLGSAKNWVLDGSRFDGIRLQAIQHQDEGFNRGSKTVTLQYKNMDENVQTKQQVNALEVNNYTVPEIKRMLQETAVEKGIPAEILKAIAYAENGFKQFDSNNEPYITDDGGIGIMQVTMTPQEMQQQNISEEKLKWDIRYNIEVGADILNEKWNLDLPSINNHEKNKLEDWYFAVMAYNGLSKQNDPNLEHDRKPYQERVYDYVRGLSLAEIAETPEIDIRYPKPDAPDIMVFGPKSNYKWGTSTATTQNLKTGDTVYTMNPYESYSKLRNGIDGAEIKKLNHYTPLIITGGPYETTVNENNHYVMYKVRGNGFEGYIASANIVQAKLTVFSDVAREEVATAAAYLQVRGILNGYPDGTYKPDKSLPRHNAAKLLVNALGLRLPAGYKMKADDMVPGQTGYEDMLIAEANGLMGNGGKLRPNEPLSRTQMASILVRAFGDYYEKPTKNYEFKDISPSNENYENINILAHNKITVTESFNEWAPTSRAHFALFLERTVRLIEEKEKK
ncbi:S-layer homology domain-containing protein [Bacillus infantis]|uniref:S-layer homology domain-containing protein n=1 Tax=Bacillus infantis TaxID=324767 RepID=UPI003CEB6DE5